MATSEKRTLEIRAKLVDLLTKPLGGMEGAVVRWAKRTIGSATNVLKVFFNLKTAAVGLLASFLSLSTVKAFGEEADALLKLSAATGDTVENLSELEAVFKLNNVAGDGFVSTLRAVQNKAREAQEGNVDLLEAFEAIGVTLEDLRTLGPSQLFEKMAAGLERFGTAQEKSVALGKILPKQTLELLNVIGGGLRKFQDTVLEARGAGATVTQGQAEAAEKLNDSLTKVQFAIGGVSRALIEQFAPDATALFERIARTITENKAGVVSLAQSVSTALVTAFGLATDAVIGFVEAIEKVVNLADKGKLTRELASLNVELREIFNQKVADRADPDTPLELLPRVQEIRARIKEITTEMEEGVAGAMRAARARLAAELAAAAKDIRVPVSPQVEVEWSKEDLERFRSGLQSVFAGRKSAGVVEADDDVNEARLKESQKRVQDLQRVASMAPGVDALRDKLIEAQRAAGVLEIALAQKEGRISLDEQTAALREFNAELDRTKDIIGTGDFFDAFGDEAEQAIAQWTDFAAAGREAAQTIVSGGLDGLTNAITSIVTGTMSAKEAFREFARATLADIARIITRLLIMEAITAAFGPSVPLARGGVVQGNMGPPVKAFASGGIASGPTLALFGEGNRREAFVPLPDNRSIPVTLNGAAGGIVVNLSVNAMDSRDVKRLLYDERKTIGALIREQISGGVPGGVSMRHALQQAGR